jgi:hypothetical protein
MFVWRVVAVNYLMHGGDKFNFPDPVGHGCADAGTGSTEVPR